MPIEHDSFIRTRSRLGCLTCRRKKKKCDQTKPKCGLCTRVGTRCEWPIPGKENTNKARRIQNKFINYNESLQPYNDNDPNAPLENFNFDLDTELCLSVSDHKLDLNSSSILDNLPLYKSPSLPLVLTLNSTELEYFEYYCNQIALNISVVPKNHNYFLKVFLPMSYHNEAVLNSLVAWGCILKAHHAQSNLQYGLNLIEAAKSSLLLKTHDFISSLTTYIILMCIEITTGSTFEWAKYLTNCYDLINQMGGFKILKDYSQEGKILAENFAYFDILASQSNENGTYYPVFEYNKIFKISGSLVDPLLGCAKPLILILGDVINLVVHFRNLNSNSNDYFEQLETILKKASNLENKLNKSKMLKHDYQVLKDTYHEQMFELYCITIRLYIAQAIRRLPPSTPQIQVDVKKANIYMDALISSPARLGLCFPLLVLGINSVSIEDRIFNQELLELLKQKYQFKSVEKIKFIINEVWNLNQNGTICVDYFEITKQYGWKLNLGR